MAYELFPERWHGRPSVISTSPWSGNTGTFQLSHKLVSLSWVALKLNQLYVKAHNGNWYRLGDKKCFSSFFFFSFFCHTARHAAS